MTSLLLILVSLTPADTGRWPAFLGAGASSIDGESVPVTWSPTENLAWRRPTVGYGQSSPVIWDGRIYLTSVEGEEKETLHVLCFDLESGEPLMDHTVPSTFPEKSSVYISRAAPTPVVDEQGVYAYFESGDVVGLSHDGQELWTRSLSDDYGRPTNEFGLSASPVQIDGKIAILIDDDGSSYLVALDKKTGDVQWKTDRTSRRSWSSPAVVAIDGKPQIVCSSAGSVDGYDVESGKQLWTFTEVGGNTGTTPVEVGQDQFLIGASPGREGDNAELARKSNGLMRIEKTDGNWSPRFVWTSPEPTPSWGSPIIHHGFAYWINRAGVVYCLNAQTGEEAYTKRIRQSAWATPVGIGDHVYVFGRDGLTTVLAAGSQFEVVAENELWSEDMPPVNDTPTAEEETEERRRAAAMFSRPTVYGVAIVNGHIVLRTGSELFCIRK